MYKYTICQCGCGKKIDREKEPYQLKYRKKCAIIVYKEKKKKARRIWEKENLDKLNEYKKNNRKNKKEKRKKENKNKNG
jgi:hypothetical protein